MLMTDNRVCIKWGSLWWNKLTEECAIH